MKKIILGRTGIEVTELCFGVLPIGPFQKNIPVEEASDIISYGLKSGINFIDTAQSYKTYPHVRLAIKKSGIIPIISTKSSAANYEEMQAAVEQALQELEVKKIDIFMLHAARGSNKIFEERKCALQCLLEYKNKGVIKAVGISTHIVGVVDIAATHPEIDIIFPLLNRIGMGVLGGTREDMEKAIEKCHENNKGVFIMKALAGGNLLNDYKASMDYVTKFSDGRFSCAIGMLSKSEIDMNIKYFNHDNISVELSNTKIANKKFLILKGLCVKCKKCVEICHNNAVAINDVSAAIDDSKCLKCGYCLTACPQFAIRLN